MTIAQQNGGHPPSWEETENILCIRLDNLGDVVMTTPAFKGVKDSKPGRKVTLLSSPAGAKVTKLMPKVDEVITYEAPWIKASHPHKDSRLDFEMVDRLKAGEFDGAVIFTVYSQSPLPAALMCYLAGIPLRLAHCRENPYHLLTHWVPDVYPEDNGRHEVRRQLDLVKTVGFIPEDERLSLTISEDAGERVATMLDEVGIDRELPWVVIHPGASAPSRRYPPEGFSEIGQLLFRKGCQVVFTGTKGERGLIQSIRREMDEKSVSLAGRLGLEELAGVLKAAPLLISNNTGPVHIAAAMGTPVVDIYALTNPQHTPWMTPNRVLNFDVPCKYCYKSICPEGHHDCLRKVPPEAVVRAGEELLKEVKQHEVR
jgi:lipopolysaccharide heptosyltransferase II